MFAYLLTVYKACARSAWKRLQGGWIVVFGLLALGIGWIAVRIVAQSLGMLGGLLMSIYEAVALTFYLTWMRESVESRKLALSDLKQFDVGLLQSIVSVLFLLYLGSWALTMVTTGIQASWAHAILTMLFVVLLNSLPETLYLNRRDGMDAIQEAFAFTTRNWIEWYLPFVLIILPIVLSGKDWLILLSQTNVFFPALAVVIVPFYVLPGLGLALLPFGLLLAHFYMLFRAKLFTELEQGSRRQRIFKSRMN